MLPLIIPGILWAVEHVVGPLLTEHSSSIVSKLTGLGLTSSTSASGFASEATNIISSVVGNVTDIQRLAIQGQIQSIVQQAQTTQLEIKQGFLYGGWLPILEWGLTISLLTDILFFPALNYILQFTSTGPLPPIPALNPIVTSLLMALIGIVRGLKTLENM